LEILKTKKGHEQMVRPIAEGVTEFKNAGFISLSFLSFREEFDGVMSAPELLRKCIADPSRRGIILRPAKYIHPDFFGDNGGTLIVVFTMFPFQ
jgi:hypothetical protein